MLLQYPRLALYWFLPAAMQSIVSFIKTLPYFYRDIQPSFTSSLKAHSTFMESKGCESPNYVLGFWYISPEQVCTLFFFLFNGTLHWPCC